MRRGLFEVENMIGRLSSHLERAVAIVFGLLALSPVTAAPVASADRSGMHLYLNDRQRWCVVRDARILEKLLSAGERLAFGNNDQARIWMSGGRPSRIEEFRTDEDAEWSTTATYALDASGAVTAVDFVTTSVEQGVRSYHFAVKHGGYRPTPSARFSSAFFRRAVSLSDFPFRSLIKPGETIGPKAKICA